MCEEGADSDSEWAGENEESMQLVDCGGLNGFFGEGCGRPHIL